MPTHSTDPNLWSEPTIVPNLRSQPESLRLGVTYAGALIEGSFQIRSARRVRRIRYLQSGVPDWKGEGVPKWFKLSEPGECGDGLGWSFSIDTHTPGPRDAAVDIYVDNGICGVDVKLVIRPGQPPNGDLAICHSPFHVDTHWDPLETLSRILAPLGCRVHYVEQASDLEKLRPQTILLWGNGLVRTNDAEAELLHRLVAAGTNLIILADNFFRTTIPAANRLLGPYDLQLGDDRADEPGISDEERVNRLTAYDHSECVSSGQDITSHPLTSGVQRIYFHRPAPILCTGPAASSLIRNPDNPAESFAAVAKPKGYVIAVGMSLWSNLASVGWPYHNDRFLANLLLAGDAESRMLPPK